MTKRERFEIPLIVAAGIGVVLGVLLLVAIKGVPN
jgi:hypothetical protein